MKQLFLSLLISFFFCSNLSLGQQYINLSVDNDLYFSLDRYYSSGIFISTGKLKTVTNQGGVSYKKYAHWTLGQEIYTPSNRYTVDVNVFDYPYGGWLFLERAYEYYKNPFSAWGASLKFGVTGKASLAPYFQNLYHNKILGLRDVVWEKALPQRFHLNFNLIQRKRIPLLEKFAFLYEWFGNMGTQRIALGGRFGFLIGTSQALSFFGNPLEVQTNEYGIYFGSRQEYRFHDFMISGSLFDNQAPFVLDAIPYKNSLEVGLAFYFKKWRFITLWNSISKDNHLQKNQRHPYLNISIGKIF